MTMGHQQSKQQQQQNQQGLEGRSQAQTNFDKPMVADLSQVESKISGMTPNQNLYTKGEEKLDQPEPKSQDGGGGGGGKEGAGQEPEAEGDKKREGKENEKDKPGGGEGGSGDPNEAGDPTNAKGQGSTPGGGAPDASQRKDTTPTPEDPTTGPGAQLQGTELDTAPLRAMEKTLGVDLSGVRIIIDDVRAAAKGAAAFVENAKEIVLHSESVKEGKPNLDLLAHEATHIAQLKGQNKTAEGAPVGRTTEDGPSLEGGRPQAVDVARDLEAEARAGATAVMGGNPFKVERRAPAGSALLNPTGTAPTAQKVDLPTTQQLDFYGNAVTVTLPKRQGTPGTETTVNVSGASSQPAWLVMSSLVLKYDGATFKGGTGAFRIVEHEDNKYIRISGLGSGPSRPISGNIDTSGKITPGSTIPPMRLRAQGLGQMEVDGIGFDKGGLKFTATLTSEKLEELAQKLVGGKIKDASVVISRAAGKVTVKGDTKFDVDKAGKKILNGELKFNDRGTGYEAEAKAKFSADLKVFKSVEFKGKYTPEKGIDVSVTLGRELFATSGGKFGVEGQVEVGYKTEAGKGLTFAGGFGVNLKINDKFGFKGSGRVGFLSDIGGALGMKLEVSGEFKPNSNIEVKGTIGGTYDFEKDQIKAKGEPSVKFLQHYTVKVPVEYDSKGSPTWKVTPTIEVDNLKLPGLDEPIEKKLEPTLPRMSIPLFGPLVIEGGPTFRLAAGIGPARVDKAVLKAQIDIDKGFEFKSANLTGKIVCPFYAEVAVGFMLGLGINIVLADGGAGFELAIRAGLPKDENANAIKLDLNADISKADGFKLDSGFDVNGSLELVGDANVYARYDTIFTSEKIYRQTLGSLKLMTYGPIGASGRMTYDKAAGFRTTGIQWKTPEFKAPTTDWVRSKFDAIRNWF